MSWVIIDKSTGVAVIELWDKKNAMKVNAEKYDVVKALDYLGSLNKQP